MGDQTTVGPMSGELAPLADDQNRKVSAENSDPATGAAAQSVTLSGNGNGNGNIGNGGIDSGTKAASVGGADNGGGHPDPDNLNIIANGMAQANESTGNGGNGNDGEGDNLAGDGGTTAEESGRPPIDTACSDGGPSSLVGMVGPPSPLTGCYLLIVLGEPHSEEHKEHILKKLLKGFLSWDLSDCHVDLENELNTITQQAPEGEEARYGERLIQYASENLVTEVLIHPQYNTLIQCMRNLLSSFTRHRHVIHAGYTFTGNGSWILQDGTFSVADFSEAFQEHDVQRVLRAYPDTISINIHCADNGLWNSLPDKNFAKMCKIRINPNDVLDTSNESINAFVDYLTPMLTSASLSDLLETSDVVGNIRFTHPTLYVFPGGQGDAALFGINGFNMLVDGGFNRKACFWDFARHLDRLDAVLLTRINNTNINGMAAVVERKRVSHVYPHIGHFFCNIPDRRILPSPDGDKDKDPLLVDLFERGHSLVGDLKNLDLKPQACYRNPEPINLYHKVGHGTLDMYVISPSRDSKEVKEFMQKWNTGDQRLFAARESREFNFPLYNLVSICALLVWQPADPDDTITRILFPGSTPDYKIQEGLEKLKHLEFMKYSTCTAKSIAPVIQTVTTRRIYKSGPIEKGIAEPVLPSKVAKSERDANLIETRTKTTVQQQQDNKSKETFVETIEKKIEKIMDKREDILDAEVTENISQKSEPEPEIKDDNEKEKEEENNKETTEKRIEIMIVKPQQQLIESNIKEESIEIIKPKPKAKAEKPRAEVKPVIRSRIDTKPPKSMEKKTLKKEDRKSSPTPASRKHDISIKPQPVKERDIKPRVISRVAKSSPSSTPAKSTKDANNRKVLESKKHMSKITISRREVTKTSTSTEKKDAKKTERKPISRRPRGTSPSKRAPGSPVKLPRPRTELKKSRLDKGGTTDSSLVSTPSADEVPTARKIQDMVIAQELDAAKQRELDDLKEEQEVVREIEAVFSRDEKKRKGELRSDHREIIKQDSTTEAEEDEEYLIIEKEELEQYTEDSMIEQESSMTKEEEIQKHQRDSQESEKKRKRSAEEEIEAEIAKAEAEERRNRQQAEAEAEEEDDDIQPDSIEEKLALTTPEKCELKAEVQEIISSAKEIAKARTEETAVKTDELSSPSPEEKNSSAKKTADTKDDPIEGNDAAKDINLQESLPEEKFSATIESGATTAPTLPEDERIPLDEIKEDRVIEEKHIKEETKETTTSLLQQKTAEILQGPAVSTERVLPLKMTFETQQNLMRDVVKTPDEVADLPVHEEADYGVYDEKDIQDASKPLSLKEEITKEEKEVEEEVGAIQEKLSGVKPMLDLEVLEIGIEKFNIEKTDVKEIMVAGEQLEESKQLENIEVTEKTVTDILKIEALQIPPETQTFPVESNITTNIAKALDLKYKTITKKTTASPDEKELSEITSEDELPQQLPNIRAKATNIKDKEDTTSLESPATIEEAIEVETAKTTLSRKSSATENGKDVFVGKSLLEELQVESEKLELESERLRLETEELFKGGDAILSYGFKKDEKVKEDRKSPAEIDSKPTKERIPKVSSAGSQKDEKYEPESKEASRPESVASHEEPGLSSINDDKPATPLKETSRSESVLSHAEELEKERRESEAGAVKEERKSPAETDSKLTEELISKVSSAGSQKDKSSEPASKEASRPESVASHENSKRSSINDEKSVPHSKETSRPESVLSHAEELEKERRESVAGTVKEERKSPPEIDSKLTEKLISKVSSPGSQKDKTSEPASKEASRPESVASHEDSKLRSINDEKSVPHSKETSRPESVMSHAEELENERRESEAGAVKEERMSPPETDSKLTEELISKVSSAGSQKDKISEPASKEASRPESVASHEDSKRSSINDEKSVPHSKETSRPESVLSHAEELEKERRESVAGTVKEERKSPPEIDSKLTEKLISKVSSAGSQKDKTSEPASKEASRPESVASHEESRLSSINDDKSAPPSEETSRPESVLSHAEELEKERRESEAGAVMEERKSPADTDSKRTEERIPKASSAGKENDEKGEYASKGASRPESVASYEDSKRSSINDEKSVPHSKETSRPESVLSHAEELEKERRESVAGTVKEERKSPPEIDSKLTEKLISKVSSAGSQKDKTSEPASKEASRPESVASHEESRLSSIKDDKSAPPSEETSRPESVLSHAEELEKERRESEAGAVMEERKSPADTDSKLTEERIPKASSAGKEKDEKGEYASKGASRPESVASQEDSKLSGIRGEKSVTHSKETSRPESVLSHAEELEKERRESEASAVKEERKSPAETDSKLTEELISKDKTSEPASKESSRPESVASHEDSKLSSINDEKSVPHSKETSRPESVLSHAEELEKERRESESGAVKEEKKSPADTDSKLTEELISKVSSAGNEKEPASKEASRPESVTSHEESKLSSINDETSVPPSKETSRPESVLSHPEEHEKERRELEADAVKADRKSPAESDLKPTADGMDKKAKPALKEASRPESAFSHEGSKPVSIKDEKSPSTSKETSRPESSLSHAEVLETERIESEADGAKEKRKSSAAADSKTIEHIEKVSPTGKQKDNESETQLKEASQPESVAGHEESKPCSIKDEKSVPPSKKTSRPESVLSYAEELEKEGRESEAGAAKEERQSPVGAEELIPKISPAGSQKEEKSEPASIEASQPESVASHAESKPGSIKDEQSVPTSKETSRPESALSHAEELEQERRKSEADAAKEKTISCPETDSKPTEERNLKVSSATSQKDEKTETASKQASRPESVASHEGSKPDSIEDDKPESHSKETSRPESVLSHAEEQEKEQRELEAVSAEADTKSLAGTDSKPTVELVPKIISASIQKNEKSEPASKEASRPNSVASHEDSKPGSINDEKSVPPSKETSRPESVLSHAEEQGKELAELEANVVKADGQSRAETDSNPMAESISQASSSGSQKEEKSEPASTVASRPESVGSHEQSRPDSIEDEKPATPSKETSRPESVLSHAEELERDRRESEAASTEADAKSPAGTDSKPTVELVPKDSPASDQKDANSEPASKEASRPDSRASHEDSKPGSINDEMSAPPSKEISRPESVLSHAEEQEKELTELEANVVKAGEKSESISQISSSGSQKDETFEPAENEASRPESVASHELSKPGSIEDEKPTPPSVETSRPESVLSHAEEIERDRRESEAASAEADAKSPAGTDSKPTVELVPKGSPDSNQKDAKSEPASKEASRPDSRASHEDSKPGSINDEMSAPPSKEISRPESVLSHADEQEKELTELEANVVKAGEKSESISQIASSGRQKDDTSEPAEKEESRPESMASHELSKPGSIEDEKPTPPSMETSRPESVLSHTQELERDRRESEAASAEADAKSPAGTDSKPTVELVPKGSPANNQKDAKSEPTSKEASRPDSRASHEDSKPGSINDEMSAPPSKEISRPESVLSHAEEQEKELTELEANVVKAGEKSESIYQISSSGSQKDETSEPAAKEASRPESVASHELSKPGSIEDEKPTPPLMETSRPESMLSHAEELERDRRESEAESPAGTDSKPTVELVPKGSPASNQKDAKSEPTSKEASRPDSRASHEDSKPGSINDEMSAPPSKEISRPESVLSHAEEQEKQLTELEANIVKAGEKSESISQISSSGSQKDETSEPAAKEESRPESVASHELSKPGSIEDEKPTPPSMETSRPESVLSHAEELERDRRESEAASAEEDAKSPAGTDSKPTVELVPKGSPAGSQKDSKSEPPSKEASRPDSRASHEDSKPGSINDEKSVPPSREISRPESVLSHTEELETDRKESIAEASKTDGKLSEEADSKLTEARVARVSAVDNQKDVRSEPATKPASWSELVAGPEESKPGSVKDEKSSPPSKETLRPKSVLSHTEELEKELRESEAEIAEAGTKPPSGTDSKPTVELVPEVFSVSSQKAAKSEPASWQASRPDSVPSKPGGSKDEKSALPSKETSRRESVLSHAEDLEKERRELGIDLAKQGKKLPALIDSNQRQERILKASPADSQKDGKSEPTSKETSWPESVASHERSKPVSIKDEKSAVPSKGTSRPESVLSHAEELEKERIASEGDGAKANRKSHAATDSKKTEEHIENVSPTCNKKDEVSETPSKESSRPDSVASHEGSTPESTRDEKSTPPSKKTSRPESVFSHAEEPKKERRESEAEVSKADIESPAETGSKSTEKLASKFSIAGSQKDEKSEPPSKESSRPESLASREESQPGSTKDESSAPQSKETSRPESMLSHTEELDKERTELEPADRRSTDPAPKEPSRTESVATDEESKPGSDKDEKSAIPTKETSKLDSMPIHAEELEKERRKSETKPDKKLSTETDSKPGKELILSTSPVNSPEDENYEYTAKEPSRPESVAGHEESKPGSVKDEKSAPHSMETSRLESMLSQALGLEKEFEEDVAKAERKSPVVTDSKPMEEHTPKVSLTDSQEDKNSKPALKEASRPESVASSEESKPGSVKDEKSPPPPMESSRLESVLSHAEGLETERRGSEGDVAKGERKSPVEADSKPKEEFTPSRPDSVASHEDSKPNSIIDEKSTPPSIETSRPESVLSHAELEKERRESEADEAKEERKSHAGTDSKGTEERSAKISPTYSQKDEKPVLPSKEASRPVPSHEEPKPGSIVNEKMPQPSKETSRPQSVLSHAEELEKERRESEAGAVKERKSPIGTDSEELTSSVSPASSLNDEKSDDRKSPSHSKGSSRPESVLSHTEGLEKGRKESEIEVIKADRKLSAETDSMPTEEHIAKVSPVGSQKADREESKSDSVKDEKSFPPSKETSRPESVLSHTEELETERKESIAEASKADVKLSEETDSELTEARVARVSAVDNQKDESSEPATKETSLPELAADREESKPGSVKDEKSSPPSKETSRPESVLSHAEELETERKESIAEASKADGKLSEETDSKLTEARVARVSAVDNQKDERSEPATKETSLPELAADREESKPGSVKDEKSSPVSKESSRPESVLSHTEGLEKERRESDNKVIKADRKLSAGTDSKPTEEHIAKVSPVGSQKEEPGSKEASRPEKIAGPEESKSGNVKDEKSSPPSKETSRPESVLSHTEELETERKELKAEASKADGKLSEETDSKLTEERVAKVSAVDNQKHVGPEPATKKASRPESVAGRKESKSGSEKDEKSSPPSKETSRPESVLNHTEELETERKESIAEASKADGKLSEETDSKLTEARVARVSAVDNQKDERSEPATKETSLPELAADREEYKPGSVKDEKSSPLSKESSRPESVLSHTEGLEKERRESDNKVIKADRKLSAGTDSKPTEEHIAKVSPVGSQKDEPGPKEASRPEKIAGPEESKSGNIKDEKSSPPSKETSRPESVLSHTEELETERKESKAEASKAGGKLSEETNSKLTEERVAKVSAVDNQKHVGPEPTTKKASRPESVASHKESKSGSVKDEKSSPLSKETSRPESVLSHTEELETERKESKDESSKADDKLSEETDSKLTEERVAKVSAVDNQKDVRSEPATKPASWPELVAGPEESKPGSVKDEKSSPPSTETLRPKSVLSHTEELEKELRESEADIDKAERKSPVEPDSKSTEERLPKDSPDNSQKDKKSEPSVGYVQSHEEEHGRGERAESEAIKAEGKSSEQSHLKKTDVKCDTTTRFPVISVRESKFPTPQQKMKVSDKLSDDVMKSPHTDSSDTISSLKPFDDSNENTTVQKKSVDTSSSPIDKAPSILSAEELQHISKLGKDSFKLDLEQQDESKNLAVVTTSSPIDVAQHQFVSTVSRSIYDTATMSANVISKVAENAKVLTDTVSSPIDEVTPIFEAGQNMEEVYENLTTSLSEATVNAVETISSLKEDPKNMALKVETIVEDTATPIQNKTIPVSEKIKIVTEQVEKSVVSETIESVQISYDVQSFHTELRETHITTIDSPAREEIILHDIKEEDEEHRFSPPRETTSNKSVNISIGQPQRPVSPREEEVAKIVANVAEVLKSEKDITEIIPDFDEKELEEKLLQTKEDDAATVQRMLVTASSEDGGEEIEICPKGSILFTPSSTPDATSGKVSPDESKGFDSQFKSDEKSLKSQPDSEKSSPDFKSAPISLEEKDKTEVSEKVQIEKATHTSTYRNESTCSVTEYQSEIRRESAVSTLSEKDLTRDESTYDKRPDSAASHNFGKFSPEPSDQTKVSMSDTQEYCSGTDKFEMTPLPKDSLKTVVVSTKITTSSKNISQDKDSFESHSDTTASKIESEDISKIYSESKDTKAPILPVDYTITKHVGSTEIEANTKCAEKSSIQITSQFLDSSSKIACSEPQSSRTKEILVKKDLSSIGSEEKQEETFAAFEESLITRRDVSSAISSTYSTVKESESTIKESVTGHSDVSQGLQAKVSSSASGQSTNNFGPDSTSELKFIEIEKSLLSKYSVDSAAFKKTDNKEQSHKEVLEKSAASEQNIKMTEHTKDSSRRESTRSQSSEFHHVSSLSDQDDEEEYDSENLKIKESRSKSIATIMMTSIYKPSDDSQAFGVLEEEESVDALIKHSSLKTAAQTYDAVQRKTALESKISESKHVMSLEQKSPDEHLDSKTPPTAPVSPGVKSTCTSDQRESIQQTGITAMQYSEIFAVSVPSSPKDVSGKSSPSESRSIPTPAGRDSFTDTPESSPKPTSPFPRMTKEDIHTTTTFGAPEVARTSTPELSELRALEKTALSGSSEKIITTTITTVTKVISSDGKEIVTEEKTITTTDTSEPTSEKVTVTTTRTTSESDKVPLQPKELATIKSEFRSSTPGSDDERPFSDDDIPPSPRSITSSQAVSYDLQRSSSGISKRSDLDIDESQDDIPPQYGSAEHSSAISISMAHKFIDPMSTSFYGALPESFGPLTTSSVVSTTDKSDPIPIRTTRTIVSRTFADSPNSQSSESEGASQTWAVRHSSDHKFLDEADLDFEKALEEHRQVRGAEVMSSVTAKYSYSPSKSEIEETVSKPKFPLGDIQKPKIAESSTTSSAGDESKEQTESQPRDPLKVWGKPLGLPSPAPIPTENDVRTTPKKERRIVAAKTKLNNEKNLRKRSESPSKTRKSNPVYVDLTYVPHNGNSYYSHVEFFKRVRARYYVFSGTEPSREVYNALLEAKQTWEDKNLEVTIIPTYDTDVLGYWVAENEEILSKYHIDLSPSASRCTINLQDHETSCSAYRLEF